MTRIWTPEELADFEEGVEAARAGDVNKASGVLLFVARCLENDWPLPEPLRLYLVAAFYEISEGADRSKVPYPKPKNLTEMRKNTQHLELPRDANAALNLKRRRGRKPSHNEVLTVSFWIDAAVDEERAKGKGLEEAIEDAADKLGIKGRTVARARSFMKQIARARKQRFPDDKK
jgi:hypothetical protein